MMPTIDVRLEGDNAWPDLEDKRVEQGSHLAIARLPEGMTSGATALALRIDLTDGSAVVVHTSMNAWRAATVALEGAERR